MNYVITGEERALLIQSLTTAHALLLALPEAGNGQSPVSPPSGTIRVYGRDGYTDAQDPRAQSARGHADINGVVIGVHLQVHTQPSQPWRARYVEVIGEGDAGGRHVAYVDQLSGHENVALFTGYNGEIDKFDAAINHVAGQEIVIDGRFDPPNLGPLAIALVRDGKIISDVVASLGLPSGHHVCYKIIFERR